VVLWGGGDVVCVHTPGDSSYLVVGVLHCQGLRVICAMQAVCLSLNAGAVRVVILTAGLSACAVRASCYHSTQQTLEK
jgi:hypothetical protein